MILCDTPTVECLVREEMFYDQECCGRFIQGYIFGFCGRTHQAPAFQVITHEGAQWARVPLHMLCWQQCEPLPLRDLCWWDCFSDDPTVHQFDFLKEQRCTALCRDKPREGTYLFTVDWRGRWAELADQHKQHHFIKLNTGHFGMFPNNKLLWKDESWITRPRKIDWKVNSHTWSCED